MNRTRSRLLHFLSKTGPSTSTQIASGAGLSPSTIRKHLSALVASGCVEVSQGGRPRKTAALYSANARRIQQLSESARLFDEMEQHAQPSRDEASAGACK
ncbi:ArsR family transcriptional regulator [Pseudarthrobacter raffinosi]|uniref:ArsR family transcriptional regulator n=1 Tax=Pseudarthrobacter raffinosi TaxID=2953651 RepID=UPI0035AC0A0B